MQAMPKNTSPRPVSLAARVVTLKRPPPLLVCRKCLKRAKDGKAIKRALKAELKAQADAASWTTAASLVEGGDVAFAAAEGKGPRKAKRAKLVMTSCFGLCPKRAVVTATAEQLARGEVRLVGSEG